MGSSAQNSSGVHWCRRRVRFNEVPEKVPKVPVKVWEALVQSQVRFNRGQQGSGEGPGEGLGGFGAEPGQVQQGSGAGSGEGLGGFGASRSGSTGVNRVPEKVREKVWEALVQSQDRFNRVPEQVLEKVWEALVLPGQVQQEVPEKVPGGFGAEPGQVQQGRFRRRFGRLWCRARSGSTGVSSAWLRITLQN